MKKCILISPWSRQLKDNSYNPKNYPYWPAVIKGLEDEYDFIQIGVPGEEKLTEDFRVGLPLAEVKKLVLSCDAWISVDNFLPHLAHLLGKPGIAIWGISDPLIFGYPENKNLLKSRKNLRENQFYVWDGLKYDKNVFVDADVVIKAVRG